MKNSIYNSLSDITTGLAELLRPPERTTVSQAASKYVELKNPGGYSGPYLNSKTPYMVEPMDCLNSRDLTNVVFVGPAQCGKTESLLLNWTAYNIKVDPMDMMLFMPTQTAARDFSARRLDRLHRNSPQIGMELIKRRDADNKTDKHYKSGIIVTLSYPSVTEVAGRPVPRCAITDYDRIPDDIGGEGSMFDLATKRNTTFKSFGMTLAESSPGRSITDVRWIPRSAHEAPPVDGGILALYNRGDRRRWYWDCPHCGHPFEGKFEMLEWDKLEDDVASAESVRMICPKNGCRIEPTEREEMNLFGRWLRDGQRMENGKIIGDGVRSSIASFWLNGVAAALTNWKSLVLKFLAASADYERTNNEESLQTFYNTDLGEPYRPKHQEQERLPEMLKARAEAFPMKEIEPSDVDGIVRAREHGGDLIEPLVPENVRFLIGTVDNQKNMFVVQVHGVSPGTPFDLVVVDRFNIVKSRRVDMDGERYPVRPSVYLEDWELITEHVIQRTYELSDGSKRRMMIKATFCDSGGEEGATEKAYEYWRSLRKKGLSSRLHLIKGDGTPGSPRAVLTYPDAHQKDKLTAARGDVPVIRFNSNLIKDTLNSRLDCLQPGKGMIRYGDWLPDWWYKEMCSEHRTMKGWEKLLKRNEAWDLCYYALGGCVSSLIRVENLDWDNPQGWFAPWDKNDLVSRPEESPSFVPNLGSVVDVDRIRALAEQFG